MATEKAERAAVSQLQRPTGPSWPTSPFWPFGPRFPDIPGDPRRPFRPRGPALPITPSRPLTPGLPWFPVLPGSPDHSVRKFTILSSEVSKISRVLVKTLITLNSEKIINIFKPALKNSIGLQSVAAGPLVALSRLQTSVLFVNKIKYEFYLLIQ